MTGESNAEALLSEWTERLGLRDWEIHLAWQSTPSEMPEKDCSGCTTFVESTKEALIFIMYERFWESKPFKFDFEKTLVHELMHLKLCYVTDIDENSCQARMMHAILDDIAKALVEAKRAGVKEGKADADEGRGTDQVGERAGGAGWVD